MKLIIDIPKECIPTRQNILNIPLHFIDGKVCEAGGYGFINLSNDITNGQVIRTLFKPNRVERTDDNVIVENYDFNKDWWNSPYQKGSK